MRPALKVTMASRHVCILWIFISLHVLDTFKGSVIVLTGGCLCFYVYIYKVETCSQVLQKHRLPSLTCLCPDSLLPL